MKQVDTQNIHFIKIGEHQLTEPKRSTTGSAGYDLRSRIDGIIEPGTWKLFGTGYRISMSSNYEAQVRSRSGLALKYGVAVLNSPGTIDSDYTQEVGVILINHGTEPFQVQTGDRIAQLVFSEVVTIDDNSESSERSGGFGSTGVM